jgi:sugar phosphate isomerase/epimerase
MSEPQLVVQTGIYGFGILGRRAEDALDETLGLIRAAGYDGVEVMSSLTADPQRLRTACADHGLTIAGLHLFWHELLEEEPWATAVALETPRLIISGIPASAEQDTLAALPRLREFADASNRHGLRLLLHNHAEECRPFASGRTVLEIVAEQLTADEIGFLVDLHWAAVGGDTRRTIETTSGRCDYYHVKDGLIDDPENPRSFDLGTGEVDLAGAWDLIRAAGAVSVAAVERAMPADPLEPALRHDAQFVRRLLAETAQVTP